NNQADEEQTEWFDLPDSQFMEVVINSEGFIAQNYHNYVDAMLDMTYNMFGKRSMSRLTLTTKRNYAKTYSVIFDDDEDGYADRQVIYQKATETRETTIQITEKTLLVGEGFSPSLQSGEWTITTEGLE
ncbi:hypothetical protein LCGC14_2062120, partial [marine sediment metagenome]